MSKLLVIGLDCLEPSLIETWLDELPTFAALIENGAWGRLRSCHPPITVPAWASMLSGRDPGELGIYGFRNRAGYGYHDLSIATSTAVTQPRVWEHLSAVGKRSIIVGVPQTWPLKPVPDVIQISSFLTPPGADYADPPQIQAEVETLLARRGYRPIQQQGQGARQQAGDNVNQPLIYETDTHNFRTEDKAQLLADIYRMTEKRWIVLNHLIQTRPWDFFMVVEMGTDRIHHAFWEYMDPDHVHYPGPHNPFERAIHDYYVYLDGQIARLLERVNEETILMVVSDHGARMMEGGFVINEWLRQEGLLVLNEKPEHPLPVEKANIDWSRTKVWSSGGYYARLFFNVAGREPQGILPAEEYESFRDEMIVRLEAIPGPDDDPLGNVVVKPQDVYRQVNNYAPDLILYPGNLAWRSVGTVGGGELYTYENDTGPDGANHDWDGVFILYDPVQPGNGKYLTGLQLEGIAPMMLTLLGVDVPDFMQGRGRVRSSATGDAGYGEGEEASVLDHLEALGYL